MSHAVFRIYSTCPHGVMMGRSWICIYLFVCILEKRFLSIHFGDGSIKYHSGLSIVSLVHINSILQRVCGSMMFPKIDSFHFHNFVTREQLRLEMQPLSHLGPHPPNHNSSIVQRKAVFDGYPTFAVDHV